MKTKKANCALSFKKVRIPIAPPGYSMETKKDYVRNSNKQVIKKEMEDRICR